MPPLPLSSLFHFFRASAGQPFVINQNNRPIFKKRELQSHSSRLTSFLVLLLTLPLFKKYKPLDAVQPLKPRASCEFLSRGWGSESWLCVQYLGQVVFLFCFSRKQNEGDFGARLNKPVKAIILMAIMTLYISSCCTHSTDSSSTGCVPLDDNQRLWTSWKDSYSSVGGRTPSSVTHLVGDKVVLCGLW